MYRDELCVAKSKSVFYRLSARSAPAHGYDILIVIMRDLFKLFFVFFGTGNYNFRNVVAAECGYRLFDDFYSAEVGEKFVVRKSRTGA